MCSSDLGGHGGGASPSPSPSFRRTDFDAVCKEHAKCNAGKTLVYISGAMTGLPGLNRAKFEVMRARVNATEGCVAITPFDIGVPDDASHADAMKICVAAMLECQQIAYLARSSKSKGVQIERVVANGIGLTPWGDKAYKEAKRLAADRAGDEI